MKKQISFLMLFTGLLLINCLILCGIKGSTNAEAAGITKEKAKNIALTKAGFTEKQVQYIFVENGTDDGYKVYEVSFTKGTKRYEYDIDKSSGKIRDKDIQKVKAANKKLISKQKAKQKALKSAGFTESQVKKLKVNIDIEKQTYVFDVEFVKGQYEYEFTINAFSGKILKSEKDRMD